ncbi:MAG TPA: hypothetical protein VFI20_09015 [Terracidiphilus sp.]|nr:hypothetical protein [Terracidiphilus sp.]
MASKADQRSLWIGVVTLVAIVALAAAVIFVPHVFRTQAQPAGPQSSPSPAHPVPFAPEAGGHAAGEQKNTSGSGQNIPLPQAIQKYGLHIPGPASGSASPSTPAPATAQPIYVQPPSVQAPAPATLPIAGTPAPPASPPPPTPQQIRQAHIRLSGLASRADAAVAGAQQQRSQRQAPGFENRGDVLAAMNRMNATLGEANRALKQDNLRAANEYMDRAEREISRLESLLNR